MPPIWTRLWSGPARALRPARGGSRSAHSRARPDGPRSSTTVLPTGTAPTARSIEQVFRAEHGRLVAGLIRRFGDIDLAEESLGDALVAALQTWPDQGRPPNPGAWLATTAANKAIDRIRRESTRDTRHTEAIAMTTSRPDPFLEAGAVIEQDGAITDDRLRLIFTCCHPALAPDARIALTLRLLGGLTAAEIARAFLVP